ncbi:hypothetical protein HDU82_001106, partial [Entophlyctis luteolus]
VNVEMVKSLWIDLITTMISQFPPSEYGAAQSNGDHAVVPIMQPRSQVYRARSRVFPTRLQSLPQGGGTYINQRYEGSTRSPFSSPLSSGRRYDDGFPRSSSISMAAGIPATRLTYTAADNNFTDSSEFHRNFATKLSDQASLRGNVPVGIPGGGVFGSMSMDDDDDVERGKVETKTTNSKKKKGKSQKAAIFEKPHTYQPMKAFIL